MIETAELRCARSDARWHKLLTSTMNLRLRPAFRSWRRSRPVLRLARVRALAAQYPRPVWLMALANLVLWTGRGMITPFVVIFFSQIAGLSASIVGTGIAVSGLGGIVFVSLAAGQIDRRGGHPVC